jgi:hypothetical protein
MVVLPLRLTLAPLFETENPLLFLEKRVPKLAGWTGLEPATFCVTGRRSNQLSYHPVETGRGEK